MPLRPYVCNCIKCKGQFLSSKSYDRICGSCRSSSKKQGVYCRLFWKNRLIVLSRDEYKCQCCGIENGKLRTNKLICHHIDVNTDNNSTSNLITLCNQCHNSLHAKFTKYVLRRSNIYKLFATDMRFGEFGKNLIYGASKQLVKKQFKGKPKLFFKKTK